MQKHCEHILYISRGGNHTFKRNCLNNSENHTKTIPNVTHDFIHMIPIMGGTIILILTTSSSV